MNERAGFWKDRLAAILAVACLAGTPLLFASCAAPAGSHQASIDSVDEDEIIEAAQNDDFPSAHAPG